jgi:hypothetical protein
MKALLPIMFLVLFSACGSSSTEPNNEALDRADSIVVAQIDSLINLPPPEPVSEERARLEELLANPIDLVSYKAEYGTSNSGHASQHDLFFRPDTVGFYYRYMLFHKLRSVLPTRPSESDLFENFRLITYKYGDSPGNFYDSDEELIAIECAMENETLGELDLVGLGPHEIKKRFGKPDRSEMLDDLYYSNQTVLTINYTRLWDDPADSWRVNWFKLVRVSPEFDLSNPLPEFLKSYN